MRPRAGHRRSPRRAAPPPGRLDHLGPAPEPPRPRRTAERDLAVALTSVVLAALACLGLTVAALGSGPKDAAGAAAAVSLTAALPGGPPVASAVSWAPRLDDGTGPAMPAVISGALTELRPTGPSPVRLVVGHIDVEVVEVGLEADGTLEVPDADNAGWYRYGPAPGQAGSAVVVGHVDDRNRPGAFFDLRDVAVGTPVTVVGADGRLAQFAVVDVQRVPKADLARSGLFRRDGPPQLALVTCGGAFDPGARHYADNVVVRAVPVLDPSGDGAATA